MTDIRTLGQIILARIAAEVPELGGRTLDKATETTQFPYAVIRAIYGIEDDAECIEADTWTIQIDVWDRASNKLRVAELGQKVRRSLKGWSDAAAVTMHPLSVPPPIIEDDPDGMSVRARLMIEAMVERD